MESLKNGPVTHSIYREGLILCTDPLDRDADWACGDCGVGKSADSIRKLIEYFKSAIVEAREDCMQLEDLLEKSTKMFHPSHYIPTQIRIKMNTAFLRLSLRNSEEAVCELLMRRKELLDEVYQVWCDTLQQISNKAKCFLVCRGRGARSDPETGIGPV